MTHLKYLLEAVLVYILFGIFKILPLDMASALGGYLGRKGGKIAGKTAKARRHIEEVFPEKNADEVDAILEQMWDNLGRVFAEYPHLKTIGKKRTTVHFPDDYTENVVKNKQGYILYGMHGANWEIAATVFTQQFDQGLTITYRPPNNPYVDDLLYKARCFDERIRALPKARETGRALLSELKREHTLGILIDQKYNEGVAVPFLGKPAMTNPVFAQLAMRFNRPMIGACCLRRPGKKVAFDLCFEEPIPLRDEKDEARALEELILDAHLMLEKWIRKDPGSWLWLHNRWGSAALQDNEEGNI